MAHHPLEKAKIKEDPSFHEYDIVFKDEDFTYKVFEGGRDVQMRAVDNLLEYDPKFRDETDYIWWFKMDDIANGETIMQSVRYHKINGRNILRIRFSGPSPVDETFDWIDENVDYLMKKIATFIELNS